MHTRISRTMASDREGELVINAGSPAAGNVPFSVSTHVPLLGRKLGGAMPLLEDELFMKFNSVSAACDTTVKFASHRRSLAVTFTGY